MLKVLSNQMMHRMMMMALLLTGLFFFGANQAKAQQNDDAHPVNGTWAVESKGGPMGTLNFSMTLTKNGDKWSGEINDHPIPMTIVSIEVVNRTDDHHVTVTCDSDGKKVTLAGRFLDGNATGEWSSGDIKGTWSATKKD